MRPPELICVLLPPAHASYPSPAQTTHQAPPAQSLSVSVDEVILTFPTS